MPYYGLPKFLLEKLRRVQNFSARGNTGSYKYDHTTPVLKSLHWLPIEQRIRYKNAVLAFKCVYGSAPDYLQILAELYPPRRTLRSSSDKLTLSIPKVEHVMVMGLSDTIVQWSGTPYDIRSCEYLDSFNAKLKTFFFLRHIISQIVFYLLQWIMYCLLNALTRYIEIYLSHINLHGIEYLVETSYIVFS